MSSLSFRSGRVEGNEQAPARLFGSFPLTLPERKERLLVVYTWREGARTLSQQQVHSFILKYSIWQKNDNSSTHKLKYLSPRVDLDGMIFSLLQLSYATYSCHVCNMSRVVYIRHTTSSQPLHTTRKTLDDFDKRTLFDKRTPLYTSGNLRLVMLISQDTDIPQLCDWSSRHKSNVTIAGCDADSPEIFHVLVGISLHEKVPLGSWNRPTLKTGDL